MAISAAESSATLPARHVFIKNQRSSQALRTGQMPTYTIQKDVPWMQNRTSNAPTVSSVYSDETNEPENYPPRGASLAANPSYHPSYHAHPQQEVTDSGPQARPSRLPIFKQVRSMLQKPAQQQPGHVAWDEYSGEVSETGKVPQVKPSAYVSPFEGAFKAPRRSPERKRKAKKDLSPISILHDDEIKPIPPLKAGTCSPRVVSPISPISSSSSGHHRAPTPLSVNERYQPVPLIKTPTPTVKSIKRKPAPVSTSPSENMAPQRSPSATSDRTEPPDNDDNEQQVGHASHFSWTTYAPTEAPDTPATHGTTGHHKKQPPAQDPRSHFSWSTVNTNVKPTIIHPAFRDSPPTAPPPIPPQYTTANNYTPTRGPPVQSILSRSRPIQRMEKEEWTPPPHSRIVTSPQSTTPKSATPTSATAHSRLRGHSPAITTHSNSSAKALPLPPELTSATASQLSHLESLLAQERDLARQRKNVERGITELTKIEKASPMEVPFATVRDAKRKLEEHRRRLEEVLLEEREIGIAISRARRKEGEEEGLWVRRVTG